MLEGEKLMYQYRSAHQPCSAVVSLARWEKKKRGESAIANRFIAPTKKNELEGLVRRDALLLGVPIQAEGFPILRIQTHGVGTGEPFADGSRGSPSILGGSTLVYLGLKFKVPAIVSLGDGNLSRIL